MINRCCLCKADGETVDRLLLHCEIASTLCHAIFSLFGQSRVMPSSVLLVDGWSFSECYCVEDGSSLTYVVLIEKMKCKML